MHGIVGIIKQEDQPRFLQSSQRLEFSAHLIIVISTFDALFPSRLFPLVTHSLSVVQLYKTWCADSAKFSGRKLMNEALAVTAREDFSVSCVQGTSGLLHVFNTAGQTISDLKN